MAQEAFLRGASTPKLDDLIQALGGHGIDKIRVSRMCAELDGEVQAFRTRTLDEECRTCGWTPCKRRLAKTAECARRPS